MKCTKIILSGLMAFAATANAMPTQEETKRVEPLVMDLMRDDQAASRAARKRAPRWPNRQWNLQTRRNLRRRSSC